MYNLISSLSLQLWDRPAGRSSLFFIQASLGLVFLVAELTRVFPLELSDAACFPALDVEGPHPGIVLGEDYRQGLPMNHEENPGLLQVSDPCFQEFNSQTVAMSFFYFKLLIKFESIYLPSVLVDLLTCGIRDDVGRAGGDSITIKSPTCPSSHSGLFFLTSIELPEQVELSGSDDDICNNYSNI